MGQAADGRAASRGGEVPAAGTPNNCVYAVVVAAGLTRLNLGPPRSPGRARGGASGPHAGPGAAGVGELGRA